MAKIDHHLHTSRHSPDSVIDPMVLVARARAVGLDGVVITEHDYQWDRRASWPTWRAGPTGWSSSRGRRSRPARGTSSSTACRTSTRPRRASPWPTCCGSSAATRRRSSPRTRSGGTRTSTGSSPQHGPAFDALELVSNNVTPQTRRRTEELLRTQPMGATGSSDAHEPEAIGCYYTEFPGPIATIADFVAALRRQRAGRGTARGLAGRRARRLRRRLSRRRGDRPPDGIRARVELPRGPLQERSGEGVELAAFLGGRRLDQRPGRQDLPPPVGAAVLPVPRTSVGALQPPQGLRQRPADRAGLTPVGRQHQGRQAQGIGPPGPDHER